LGGCASSRHELDLFRFPPAPSELPCPANNDDDHDDDGAPRGLPAEHTLPPPGMPAALIAWLRHELSPPGSSKDARDHAVSLLAVKPCAFGRPSRGADPTPRDSLTQASERNALSYIRLCLTLALLATTFIGDFRIGARPDVRRPLSAQRLYLRKADVLHLCSDQTRSAEPR